MSQKSVSDLFYNISEYIGINEQISFELSNGFINGDDGSVIYGSTLRLVTTDFINRKSIRIINSGSVCKYNVAAYSDTGYIGESGWKTETNTYKIPNATKYKLVFAFTNDAVITPSDFDSLGISVTTDDNGNVIHSDKSQPLSDSEKQIARSNINAASATDVDNISNKLNVITSQLMPDVGSFYKNAWIRYSDGYFSTSSGGAKIYRIKKTDLQSDSTKFFIKTNTESNTFAAVAFYSTEEPSTDSYLKDISVQGINDRTASHVYEVEIPGSGWVSAFVLFMSQYSTDFYIKTNGGIVIFQQDLDNACEQTLQKSKEAAIDLVSPLFNPFALKPFYHHMNQEVNKPAVPGQSLQDIAYAKALGFDMIEANVMKTSDGVHVTKHGLGGKLGNGIKSVDGQDYSNTLFSDVTSAWLRENITYDSLFSKNNTFIPTLAEFCSECKRLSMKVKLGNYSQGALDVARKYLPDDMIFAGSESNRNSGFRGLIEQVWSPTQSIDDKIQECKNIKAPINIVISAGTFTQCTDEQLLELSEKAHQAGFTTSMVYPTTSDAIRALKFGIDAICSTDGSCNILYHGNAENVYDINDNSLVITGGSYDESTNTITLPTGATIKLDAANAYRFGLCSIRTIYRGKLSFALGGVNVLSNYESDGVQPVAFCNVIQPDNSSSKKNNWCVVTAVEDTVINDLKINCSII